MSTEIFDLVMGRVRKDLELDSETQLAMALGMKPAAYFNRKKAGSIPYELVIKLCKERGLDLEWVLGGIAELPVEESGELSAEGEVRMGKRAATRLRRRDTEDQEMDFSDFELVQRRGIVGSAGAGAENIVIAQQDAIAFRRDYLRSRGVRANQLIVAEVSGDSMEPTLFHQDLVVFDSHHLAIAADDIYLYELEGRLFIKRLRYKPGGVIEIISDNRDRYPPIELTEGEAEAYNFDVRGRFFWRGGERLQ